MLKTWTTDARYAARRLRARPDYALVAILTLALGIGGTAAVYGIARPVIFDPLPYANAHEVGTFWMQFSWTEEEFLYLRGRIPGFRMVAAYRPGDVTMRNGNAPARLLPGLTTSAELFDVLGARPLIGRALRAGDDVQGAEPVAVLSYGLWQELGGSPSILGQRITLDDIPRTVIGVMPRGFWFPDPSVRIWLPKPLDPESQNGSYTFIGRVAPGLDVRHLDPYLRRLTAMLAERFKYPVEWDKTRNPKVTPLRDELLGPMRPALVATFVAMGLILLIACTNVSALMLGQVEGRTSELAVRSALGATSGRITQQLVVEALLLGVGAGAVGAGLAAAGFHVLAGALPIAAWGESATFDWTLSTVALATAIVAVVLIALAMLIASGAALLVRSVSNLYAIDRGIETRGIAVVDVVSSGSMSDHDRRRTIERLSATLGELPAVRSAAAAMKLPLRGRGNSFGIIVEGREEREQTTTHFCFVVPSYFHTKRPADA